MHVFAMVTTRHSNRYTDYALSSLFQYTQFAADDERVLIDNDGAYGELPLECRGRVQLWMNPEPRSFAANVNQAMKYAGDRRADLVFLNNDLIFSPQWFEPLQASGPFLLSPVSQAEVFYSTPELHLGQGIDLPGYLGKEELFAEIVRRHQRRATGYQNVLKFPFFAVKIPFEVYSTVGAFDERFGVGGGEDTDYCIRCHQQGIAIRFALSSYLLHFTGKSTWRGAETSDETESRNRLYRARFRDKWGRALAMLMIDNDPKGIPADLMARLESGDFKDFIEECLRRMPPRPGRSKPGGTL